MALLRVMSDVLRKCQLSLYVLEFIQNNRRYKSKMKNNSYATVCGICNVLITLILTTVTWIILYHIFESVFAAVLISFVFFWGYAWIEEKCLSKYVNSIVCFILKDK